MKKHVQALLVLGPTVLMLIIVFVDFTPTHTVKTRHGELFLSPEDYTPQKSVSNQLAVHDAFMFKNATGALQMGFMVPLFDATYWPWLAGQSLSCSFPSSGAVILGTVLEDPHHHTAVISCPVSREDIKSRTDLVKVVLQARPIGCSCASVTAEVEFNVEIYPEHDEPEHQISVQTRIVFQTELDYVIEWIQFHRILGIGHFYIYDSIGGVQEHLESFCRAGIVTVIWWQYPGDSVKLQIVAQNHALYRFGMWGSRWLGFHDIDEYMVPIQGYALLPVLESIYQANAGDIGSVRISGWEFGNFQNHSEHSITLEMYLFKSKNVEVYKPKNYVVPRNVMYYSVHMITSGGKMVDANPITELVMNHYFARNNPGRAEANNEMYDDFTVKKFGSLLTEKLGYIT